MLIDFRQFLYDSVEKVLFKADLFFAWQKCKGKHNKHPQLRVELWESDW